MVEKLNLKNVTMVSVAGTRQNLALAALKHSCKEIEFHSVKLFSSKDMPKDSVVEIIKVDDMNYERYNWFIAYELWKHIDSEFVLIIQDDGYVANPLSWQNVFFDYDYIGAPWALPHDDFSYRDAYGNLVRVGNGGFSLRSKKLLELPTKLNMKWEQFFGFWNEDGFFTCKNRHLFEAEGCKFASIEVAKYFSIENFIPEMFGEGIVPFGFHGVGSPYNVLGHAK